MRKKPKIKFFVLSLDVSPQNIQDISLGNIWGNMQEFSSKFLGQNIWMFHLHKQFHHDRLQHTGMRLTGQIWVLAQKLVGKPVCKYLWLVGNLWWVFSQVTSHYFFTKTCKYLWFLCKKPLKLMSFLLTCKSKTRGKPVMSFSTGHKSTLRCQKNLQVDLRRFMSTHMLKSSHHESKFNVEISVWVLRVFFAMRF